jgi:succinate-semialdehyde dehydrogenase/glutarate-semialdehyde dehydrogenase
MSATPELAPAVLEPVDPATLRPLERVPVTDPAAVSEAVSEARAAQAAWARTTAAQRAAVLRDVARRIVEDDLALARTVVDETGKPLVEAYTHDLFVAVEALTWLARHGCRALAPERLPIGQPVLLHKRARVTREPLGVAAIVAPWNFPIGVPLSQAAAAIVAGNAVVLKPSELTPHSGALVERLFREAGAPPGLVRVVQGPGHTVGDALVGHHGVDAVIFTGSTATGRRVAARAAERLCPVTLELGGKDPMLVLDDADLERAIDGALWGGFANCGQVCAGVERVYVHRAVLEPFLEQLAARASALRIGDGHDARVDLGPLISEQQRALVERLVADALEHGAAVVCGGNRPAVGLPGWFHEPTVLLGEPPAARIRVEEIFGPVLTVVSFDDVREAVRRANDTPYALGASVWTRDRRRAQALGAELRAGSVWHNDHAYSYGAMAAPWGGRGASGIGRTHGREGLRALTHVKLVDVDGGRVRPGWWYPYSDAVVDGFRGILGGLYADGTRARVGALARHRRGVAHLLRRSLR